MRKINEIAFLCSAEGFSEGEHIDSFKQVSFSLCVVSNENVYTVGEVYVGFKGISEIYGFDISAYHFRISFSA